MSRESKMVTIATDENGEPSVWCDPEIEDLVTALQTIGTITSCSGHGNRPGRISLADGRELFIVNNYEQAFAIDAAIKMPDINGEPSLSAAAIQAQEG